MSPTNKRIYLSPPHMSGHEMKYIKEAFDTNWVAPLGPNVDAFEKSLAEYCSVKHAVALSSGTAAIHLALIILGVNAGDEVIVPTFTFSATVNPIVYQGATPVFIDSEPETWNMDPELLEKSIKERLTHKTHNSQLTTNNLPKAIIVVHLYGMPAKMDEIIAIADKYGIPVIEDAAEALGSKYKGKPLGSIGKVGVLSFNGNKIITTSGGGALISDDRELIEKARFLATQARDKAPHYQHSQIGFNYRMSNVLAGIGRGQMEVINERVLERRNNFLFYKQKLDNFEGIKFLEEPGEEYFSNRWLITILLKIRERGKTRESLRRQFEMENIESRPLWKPMHLQPVFSSYPAYLNGLSQDLFKIGLCLPSGSDMSDKERRRILKIVKEFIT
ncbi:MAG: aminotransferase class I/II-fold pyridoxal phosphate-dependent enzyme [Bacteroidales bacterium]|nr:aminotransferase class I/II-fold pyridoxal phosphate-dependent enzyme [Bacteroidales bacterium]